MIYNLGISLLWIVFSYEFNLDKYMIVHYLQSKWVRPTTEMILLYLVLPFSFTLLALI